jgi:enamine deaminase RidA (YjgF/YER057c/UK114 family)
MLYLPSMREFRSNVPGLCDPPEPYSYAVRAGNTIYLAGQVALDADGRIVGSSVAEQAEQVWDNIERVLNDAGGSLADIVQINYFLQDVRCLPEEIEVRSRRFAPDRMPAVTAVQAAALGLPGLLMEVEVVAVVGDD